MKLESLIHTIGSAVQDAHKNIENNTLFRFFDNYFERSQENNSDEIYTPKMIQVEIPSPDTGRAAKVVYTPIAALVHHDSLNIDTVKLNLNIGVVEETDNNFEVSPSCNTISLECFCTVFSSSK